MTLEIRQNPPNTLTSPTSTTIVDANANIINSYQSGALSAQWSVTTGGYGITSLGVQQPGNQTTTTLSTISYIQLVTAPGSCRQQSPCTIQPVVVAYDNSGAVMATLGSNDEPWQVVASVTGVAGVNVIGAIANYVNGQSQFTSFGITATGAYTIQFTFITPSGVSK